MFPSLHMFDSVGPRSMGEGGMPAMQPGLPAAPKGMFAAQPRRGGIDLAQLGAMILAANGNPLGQFTLTQAAERREAERQSAAQAAARQQEMADRFALWQQQRQYDAQNPRPTEFDRNYQTILSRFGPEAASNYARNVYDPVRSNFAIVNGQPGFINQRTSQIGGGGAAPSEGLSDDEFDALGDGGSGSATPSNFPGLW